MLSAFPDQDMNVRPTMMLRAIFFISIDQDLSRLDPLLLSQQSSMEIFFDGVKNKEDLINENGNYTDIGSWAGIRLNADADVIAVDFEESTKKSQHSLSEGHSTLRTSQKRSLIYGFTVIN